MFSPPTHYLRHALILVFCLLSSAAFAQPVPSLSGLTPIYLRQGESRDITLTGANLAGATSIAIVGGKAVSAELIKPSKPTPNQARLKLTAAANTPLGDRELRLVTPLGVTPPLALTVGQFAATEDKEPNNTPEQATPLTFPTSIIGRIETGGDVDSFRFDAKKDQHLVFDLYGSRVGSALDPVLVILDAEGHEQTKTTSFRSGDPTVVFIPPADGLYILQIRDVQYRGGGDFTYRIDAGEIPFVESILPASGLRGSKVEVTAIGHNLGSSAKQTVDLTDADAGLMDLRFQTPSGFSNSIGFEVTSVSQVSSAQTNHSAKTAASVSLPAEVSGVLTKPGDEDFYRFTVTTKQQVSVEVFARQSGSPVDALLTLRDANGNVLEQNNGAGESEARISRSFEPGDYLVSIRDLTFGGGANFGYRLHLLPAAGAPADFAVRFMPDSPRVARRSNTKVWCEVVRLNGYKGNINVSLDGAPPGVEVTGGFAAIGDQTSGIFTLSASAEAELGTTPIRLKAVGSFGAQQAVHYGQAELNSRPVRGAYLTVLDKPPFTVDAMVGIRPEQVAAYPTEVQRLTTRLFGQSPELDQAQAEWEKKLGPPMNWQPLANASVTSASGSVLARQPDDSIVADPKKSPDRDNYTVSGSTSLKEITALRLEVLPDPAFPSAGPGRNIVGNFVLNKLSATIAPKDDPTKATPIVFTSAKATFEQEAFGAKGAIDDDPATGWAIFGGTGKPQTAWFFPEKPIPAGDVVLAVTLSQQFGQQHTLGKFRLTMTDDPTVKDRQGVSLPAPVAEALKTPTDNRSPEQKQTISAYYRANAPELKADKIKLDTLRSTVGPYAEVARLEATLDKPSPALDAEQKLWEDRVAAGNAWTTLDVQSAKSANGAILTKQKDGSVLASGAAPATDVYTVTVKGAPAALNAIRLEALPDESLPNSGPGRAGGNFVLTRFTAVAQSANKNGKLNAKRTINEAPYATISLGSKDGLKKGDVLEVFDGDQLIGKLQATAVEQDESVARVDAKDLDRVKTGNRVTLKAPPAAPIEFASAVNSFEQKNWPIAGALDDSPTTGWAVSPLFGVAHHATLTLKEPLASADSSFVFTLEFNHPKYAGFSLGRFRLLALGSPDASSAAVPTEIRELLKVAVDKRTPEQKATIAAYYRTISPALEPTRQRLAELKRALPPTAIIVAKNKAATIAVPITRLADFTGPVTLTLEGFVAGRDPATRQPQNIARSIDVTPVTADPETGFVKLTFKTRGNSEVGTRMVVIRAEGKVGNDTFVQYSPAFPISVSDK